MQLARRAVAGKQVVTVLYMHVHSIQSDLGTGGVGVSMYDAISRDCCVCVSLCLFAGVETGRACERGFVSAPLLEFMHLPTNPETHQILFNEHTHCDVTDLRFSQTLGAWWPLRLFAPFLHTDGPKTLVYRDLISRHPGRYIPDHKQAGTSPCWQGHWHSCHEQKRSSP